MYKKEMDAAKANVSSVLSDKFSAKGRTLEKQLKAARRTLPKGAREEVEFLIDSEHKLKHPVLRSRVDPKRVEAISRSFDQRSGNYNRKREKSRARYSLASGIILSMLASSFVFYAVLVWIGAL